MTLARPVRAVVVDASSMVEVAIWNTAHIDRFAAWQDAGALVIAPAHFGVEVAKRPPSRGLAGGQRRRGSA
jgi:hypothetical protein